MNNKDSMASVSVATEEESAFVSPALPVHAPVSGKRPAKITKEKADEILNAIKAIDGGPRALKLYMEMCATKSCGVGLPIHSRLSRGHLSSITWSLRPGWYLS